MFQDKGLVTVSHLCFDGKVCGRKHFGVCKYKLLLLDLCRSGLRQIIVTDVEMLPRYLTSMRIWYYFTIFYAIAYTLVSQITYIDGKAGSLVRLHAIVCALMVCSVIVG